MQLQYIFWARYRHFIDFVALKVIVQVDVSSDHMNKSSHNINARVGASNITSYKNIAWETSEFKQWEPVVCVCFLKFIYLYFYSL